MHDHSKRKALGSARLKVEHEGNKHERNFVIVDQEVSPLLGLKSLQGMGLVKIIVPGVDNPVNNVVTAPEIESAFYRMSQMMLNLVLLLMCFKVSAVFQGNIQHSAQQGCSTCGSSPTKSACSQEGSNENRA